MFHAVRSFNPVSEIALESIPSRFFACRDIRFSVLRLDAIHHSISGNKWFKLMPALERAQNRRLPLLSFGGAWSNHIHALAYAGYRLSIKTFGIIRGEPEYAANAMLSDARRWGMQLCFVSREEYRRRHEPEYQQYLQQRFEHALLIPEGGSNEEAVDSVRNIWRLPALCSAGCDYLVTAVGTGGTLAGLVAGRPAGTQVLGVPVLKYDQRLVQSVQRWLPPVAAEELGSGWRLLPDGHQGGYARVTAELARAIYETESRFGLPLDPVYTGKALMALVRHVLQGGIAPGSHVILLHTGGLQGRRGMASRLAALAPDFVGPLAL